MDAYIAGAENLVDDRVEYAKTNGLSPRVGAIYRVPSAPWRKVWHTMEAPEDDPGTVPDEGWELDQLREHAVRHRTPPHLWAAPLHDWVGQTVPLDLAAYALRHDDPPGVRETNHAHAIQTEVIGYAIDGPLRGAVADWLGRRVLGPILAAGAPITPFVVAPSTGADGYGENGRVRMSWDQWAKFGGQCGHANVPGQQHWDPGVADYLRIARAATQEDDLTPEQDKMLKAIAVSTVPFYQDAQPSDGRFQVQTLMRRAVSPALAAIAAKIDAIDFTADVDEVELAGLLADLVPDNLSGRVVDELHRRTAPTAG